MTAITIADARKQFSESQQGQRVRERLQSSGLVVERRRRI